MDEEQLSLADDEESLRCYRVRSMIAGEKQQALKAYYQLNSRPTGSDLERLAARVAFPKRVVQVWFQNMRARDRRKGKPIPDGRTVPKRALSPGLNLLSPLRATTYTRVGLNIPLLQNYNRFGGDCQRNEASQRKQTRCAMEGSYPVPSSSSASYQFNNDQNQPLDLSLKVINPPVAHSRSLSTVMGPVHDDVDGALDLSIKSSPETWNDEHVAGVTLSEPALCESRSDWQFMSLAGSDTPSSPSASSLRSLTAVSNIVNERGVSAVSSPDQDDALMHQMTFSDFHGDAKRSRRSRHRLVSCITCLIITYKYIACKFTFVANVQHTCDTIVMQVYARE